MPTNAFLRGQPGHRGSVSIAVLGAGLSGTLAAVQLAARLPPEDRVLLFEQGPTFAPASPMAPRMRIIC